MSGVTDAILGSVLLMVVIGALSAVLLAVAWKVFRLAAVAFITGCGVFYLGGLYMMIFQFRYYWGQLTGGDIEAVWLTAYVLVVTLALIGYFIWTTRSVIRDSGNVGSQNFSQKEEPRQKRPRFQEPSELKLRDLELLGLERTSGEEEIKQAYRRLSKQYHPDLNPDPHATIIFNQIQKAYNNLIDQG